MEAVAALLSTWIRKHQGLVPTSALSRPVRGEVNKDLRSRTPGLKAGHGSSHMRPGTGESIGTWATELQTFRLPAIAGKCMADRGPDHQNGHLKHTCTGATANTAQPPSGANYIFRSQSNRSIFLPQTSDATILAALHIVTKRKQSHMLNSWSKLPVKWQDKLAVRVSDSAVAFKFVSDKEDSKHMSSTSSRTASVIKGNWSAGWWSRGKRCMPGNWHASPQSRANSHMKEVGVREVSRKELFIRNQRCTKIRAPSRVCQDLCRVCLTWR